jgi:hypothetical protein
MGRQQPNKPSSAPVQTGSYKETVVGLKMAIIDRRHPGFKPVQAKTDMIQAKLGGCGRAHCQRDTTAIFEF